MEVVMDYYAVLKEHVTWENLLEYKWYVTGTAIAAWLLGKLLSRPRNLPPGPMGLPIVGAAFRLSSEMHNDLVRMGKTYGDVFCLSIFGKLTLVLNSQEAIKEAFVKQSENFSHRQGSGFAAALKLHDDIFVPPYNDQWKANKKFARSTLRTYGFGTSVGETKILDQMENMSAYVSKCEGKPINPDALCQLIAGCVVHGIMLGKSYSFDDPEFLLSQNLMSKLNEPTSQTQVILIEVLSPWLSDLFAGSYKKKILNHVNQVRNDLKGHIDGHKKDFDPDNPRDVVDGYLKERGVENLDSTTLANTILAFSGDAIFTMANVINCIIWYVTKHQDVQARVQEQLDEVVGSSRKVTLKDKPHLPVVDALIFESLRMQTPVTLSPPRETHEDVTFRGFNIPKGTAVIANLWAVHMNPKVYPNPEKFDVQHFLKSDGSLIKSNDDLMPFGSGTRMCLGEQLSRSEMFLVVANILMRYKLTFAEGYNPQDDMEGLTPGMIRMCREYTVHFTER